MNTVWAAKMQGSSCTCWGSMLPHATRHHAATSSLSLELKPHWYTSTALPLSHVTLLGAEASHPGQKGPCQWHMGCCLWMLSQQHGSYTAHSVPAGALLHSIASPNVKTFPHQCLGLCLQTLQLNKQPRSLLHGVRLIKGGSVLRCCSLQEHQERNIRALQETPSR